MNESEARDAFISMVLTTAMNAPELQNLKEACAGVPRSGGPARFVRMFKPRFAEMVASGKKTQTIRLLPKRIPRRGDLLSLRTWEGQPYRSKQRVLREAVVQEVRPCFIREDGIYTQPRRGSPAEHMGVNCMRLRGDDADRFARADGFGGWSEMLEWFLAECGLPFDGIAIFWEAA